MSRPKYKRSSISQKMKQLFVGILVILIVYMIGNIFLIGKIREQTLKDMDKMSTLYTNELDSRFLRISRKLFSTIMEKHQADSVFWTNVRMILKSDENIGYPVGKLRDMYLSNIWEYGQEYQMFLYLGSKDEYWHLSLSSQGAYSAPREVEIAMINQVKEIQNSSYSVKKKWNIVNCNGENYICKIAQTDGVSLGCFVNVKSILEPFSELTEGENGYVRLVDANDKIVGMITSAGISERSSSENMGDYSICKTLSQAPFAIQMKISTEQMMKVMMGSVTILGLIACISIGGIALIFVKMKRSIIAPVQAFTRKLENYGEEDYTFAITENNLLELEQIDDKFKHMIHQIRKLKITIYEQELEKQKIEMEYLKLQVRPHFYLNCLNFIFSMIDFKKYDCAKQMTSVTADYLSYIFRNAHDLVPITAETSHCEDYLKILLLRYPDQFEYYIEVQKEVEDAVVLPFLIQNFVENASKHALTLAKKVLISITVYPEEHNGEKYVNIYVSDTGMGFPDDVLCKLQNNENISEDGKHVGLDNCRKRFYYYYKESGKINFENSPLGGAIVDIHIPYETGEKYETVNRR